MFEWVGGSHSAAVRPPAVTTTDLKDWLAALAALDADVSDAERIQQLRALEELKSAAAAAQVRVTADLDESVRAERAARGVPASERGRGIGAQVAGAARVPQPRRTPPRLRSSARQRDATHPGGCHRRRALRVARDPPGPRDRMPVPGGPR